MLKIIIISGFGINCEEETYFAFSTADSTAQVNIVHINDLVDNPKILREYHIMSIPGGFSYGDHTGAGNAFSWYLKNHLVDEIQEFRQDNNKLIIGICNGCQILTKVFSEEFPVKLLTNTSKKYQCEWVDIVIPKTNSIWCSEIKTMRIPIAHGEGRFKINSGAVVDIAMQYNNNPNGSDQNIAALTSNDGRILAMMPHPERAIMFTSTDIWSREKERLTRSGESIPKFADGIRIFQNAVNYYK